MRHAFFPGASGLAFALGLAPFVSAQQFQHQSGWIPGTPRWSEGVEAADVDRDGDLDLFFADGEGYNTAGVKRQNVLVINDLVETGAGVFTDESLARLGAHVSNAKGVITGDVNGDGWVDALFLNAFHTDPPSLYINRGAAQPGYFDLESATRGLTEALSSAGGQFGDVDDDGDLDLVITDAGPNFLSAPGGKPRLYLNDGTGHFVESAGLNAPTKVAPMDIQLTDFDEDWDLDVLGVDRAANSGGNHYLLLNDGTASFSNSSGLLPQTSTNCYEAEVGDLDGDTDQDIFFISVHDFQEGHVENLLVPSGSLQFVAGMPLSGNVDDNEVALLDSDVDGDLDVIIGSLGVKERLYENQGGLVFVEATTAFTSVSDSTLDLTVADVDGDGAYDVVTAQGESNPGQWANKIYRNTGLPDTLPPVIETLDVPVASSSWPIVVHAKVHDQVVDDGQSYLSSRAAYAAVATPEVDVVHQGGNFVPGSVQVTVGTPVRFVNRDASAQSAKSLTAPWTFDYPLAGSGGSAERVFLSPGTYLVTSTQSGALVQIDVVGTVAEIAGFHSGGELWRFALEAIASGSTGEIALEVFFDDFVGNESVTDSQVFSSPTCDYAHYCTAAPNSAGPGALMDTNGETSVAENQFVLTAGPAPVQPGLFFYSAGQTNGGGGIPFGNGFRCVGTPSDPIFRLPVIQADASGTFTFAVDFTSLPVGGAIQGGTTWNFQCWFRDPAAGGAAFNLSDGLRVTFCF
jgi:plastocyanin